MSNNASARVFFGYVWDQDHLQRTDSYGDGSLGAPNPVVDANVKAVLKKAGEEDGLAEYLDKFIADHNLDELAIALGGMCDEWTTIGLIYKGTYDSCILGELDVSLIKKLDVEVATKSLNDGLSMMGLTPPQASPKWWLVASYG